MLSYFKPRLWASAVASRKPVLPRWVFVRIGSGAGLFTATADPALPSNDRVLPDT